MLLVVIVQHSKSSVLAVNGEDFVFLDSSLYSRISPCLTGTLVLGFRSPLYFATLTAFNQQLFAAVGVSPSQLSARRKLVPDDKQRKNAGVVASPENSDGKTAATDCATDCDGDGQTVSWKEQCETVVGDNNVILVPESVDVSKDVSGGGVRNIIVECSSVSFVDTAGCLLLARLHADYAQHGLRLVLAGCCESVVTSLRRSAECRALCQDDLYPSVQSAVLCLHRGFHP